MIEHGKRKRGAVARCLATMMSKRCAAGNPSAKVR